MVKADDQGAEAAVESRPADLGGGLSFQALVYVGLMVLIGSSTAPAARYAVRDLPVGLVPLVRFGLAGVCLLPVVGRCGGQLGRLFREDGWRLALAALCCVPINQTFFLNATRLTATSHVALIYAAVPMVVLVLAAALGQEQLRTDRLAGVAASVAGVAVIGLDSLWRGGSATASASATLRGDLLLVGAVVSWGAYLTVSKPMVGRHGAITTLAGVFLAGSALDVPIALASLPGWPPLATVSAAAWWGLVYLTIVSTVLTLVFQNLALQHLDASQVATFGNAAPLLTVLWGVLLFGETVNVSLAVGGALTLGGIAWTGRGSARSVRAAADAPALTGPLATPLTRH